ncbi:uncharacterized protein LOC124663181 [Lolium rigidum]|uniref:uncharacterized protein LOC124663181 n=1 Tax=Lolium rigidum TaxID=89674 RepID=UPI001F5E1152|nr:uncharacterized protein LOC124663181 [Lolium rigidum]
MLDDLPDEIVVHKILISLPPKDVGHCRAVRRSWRDTTTTPEFTLAHHQRQPSLPIIDGLPSRLLVFFKIVVHKILVSMRPKDVGRCRAVRRSWRDPTTTPEFTLGHHRHQPSLPIVDRLPSRFVVLHGGSGDGAVSDQQLWAFHPNPTLSGPICLHASTDGLLVISHGCRFHIYSPAIRRHALLPQPEHTLPCNSILDLYRHGTTGEYRVLWSSTTGDETALHVLTVGDNESRSVRVTMPSSPSLEQAVLQGLPRDTHYTGAATDHPPVHHRGNLHSMRRHRGATDTADIADIIVFDAQAESFRLMHTPVKLAYLDKLLEMEGKLALYSIDHRLTAINVWVMQEYEAEIWAFMFRIDVSMMEASQQLYLTSYTKKKKPLESTVQYFTQMAVLNERELLIRFNEKHVLRCDVDGNFLGILNIGKFQSCMLLTQHRLQDSIIPIPPHT